MSWGMLAAIYLVVWWICLFVVLPIGVRTQADEGESILGTAESAPVRPMLVRKALATTVLAAVVVALFWLAQRTFGFDLESISQSFRI